MSFDTFGLQGTFSEKPDIPVTQSSNTTLSLIDAVGGPNNNATMIQPPIFFGVLALWFNLNFNSFVCSAVKHNQLETTKATHRYLKKSRRKSSFKKRAGAYGSKSSHDGGKKDQKRGSEDMDTNMAQDWNYDHHLADDTTKMMVGIPTCRPLIGDAPVVEPANPVVYTTTAPAPVTAVPIPLSPPFKQTEIEPSSSITSRPVGLEDTTTTSAQPSLQTPLPIYRVPSIAPITFETPTPSSANQDPGLGNPTSIVDPSELPIDGIPSCLPYETPSPSSTIQDPVSGNPTSTVEPSEFPFDSIPSSAPYGTPTPSSANQDPVLGNPTSTVEPSEFPFDSIPSSAPYNHVETSTPTYGSNSPTMDVGDSSIEPSHETPPVDDSSPSRTPTTSTTTTTPTTASPSDALTPFGESSRPSQPPTTDISSSLPSRVPLSLTPSSLEPSRGGTSDTMTQLPTTTVYPSSGSPILSDDGAVFQDDDIIGRMIQVDLNPFQLLFLYNSSSSSSASTRANVVLGTLHDSDETRSTTKILQITKEHLTKTLVMWDDVLFRSLELFPVKTERNELNSSTKKGVARRRHDQGWTTASRMATSSRMMTFAGSAFFDHDTVDAVLLQDRVDTVTMLAFLGTNLTRYTQLLQLSLNVSITEAQLYTVHGYRMAYTNGTMYVETENSNEVLLDGDDATVWIYLVAVGLLSLVGLSLLLIGGHHVLMSKPMQQSQYSRVVSVSPVPLGTKPIPERIPPPSSRS